MSGFWLFPLKFHFSFLHLKRADEYFGNLYVEPKVKTVRHLWPSRASFVLNYYFHWSSLVLRNGNGTYSFMHSRDGVM